MRPRVVLKCAVGIDGQRSGGGDWIIRVEQQFAKSRATDGDRSAKHGRAGSVIKINIALDRRAASKGVRCRAGQVHVSAAEAAPGEKQTAAAADHPGEADIGRITEVNLSRADRPR